MSKITLLNQELSQVEAFDFLSDFSVKPALIAQVVRSEMMNLRSGNAHAKTRGEVRGGGKKPWRQKGTGRARHGSRRSPIWVGGGVTHGPRNTVNWSCKINKSSRISALKSIIKDRLDNQFLFQFPEQFTFAKTKTAIEEIQPILDKKELKLKSSIIIYTLEDKENLRGLLNTDFKFINVANLKIFRLVQSQNLIFTPLAKDFIEKRLSL